MIYDSDELLQIESRIKESLNVISDIKASIDNDFKIFDDLEYDGLTTIRNNTNSLDEIHNKLCTIIDNHIKEMDNVEKEQLNIIDKYIEDNVSINNYYSGEKITIDSIVLDKTNPSEILNNYVKEVIPTLSYDMKKETLNNILNGEETLTSILINEDESDIFVYQLNNILKDKYDIKIDKLSKEDETMIQRLFLDNISNNDTNIFENSKSILSGLSYYKYVAKKNDMSLSDLIFDNDELLLESTKELYENIGTDLLTDDEINNFREYIDNVSKNNNISSLDLLSDSKYISLIKGGISYES